MFRATSRSRALSSASSPCSMSSETPTDIAALSDAALGEVKSTLKRELKEYESTFAEENGREPDAQDKREGPMFPAYARYFYIKVRHPLPSTLLPCAAFPCFPLPRL